MSDLTETVIGFFTDTVQVRFFKDFCIIITLFGGLPISTRFDDLHLVLKSQVCQNHKLQMVVDAYENCESVMISFMLSSRLAKCLYMAKTLNVVIFLATINMISVKLCMMIVLMEFLPIHSTFSGLAVIIIIVLRNLGGQS